MAKVLGFDANMAKKVTCRHCTAVIEYTANEVRKDYTTDYTGSKDYYSFISCPNCGKEVHVK